MNKIESTIEQLKKEGEIHSSSKFYEVGRENGMTYKEVKDRFLSDSFKVKRGQYRISYEGQAQAPAPVFKKSDIPTVEKSDCVDEQEEIHIPPRDPVFVTWGSFHDLHALIDSKMFIPTMVTGASGNGKTLAVQQACASLGREYIRVQISPETDESDLIGGWRLKNGETQFYKGPVIKAMERGAILLLDEIDRNQGNKIMCLQGILEGKPYLVKKIGQVISPKEGFNIIATANTKGLGSDDGKYSSATIIDDAFLERFVNTIEQESPPISIEKKILDKHGEKYGYTDSEFISKLVSWADVIRKTYKDGGIDDVISTRRLCHVIQTYSIFKDRLKAIKLCINRYDSVVADAFLDLYTKLDGSHEQDKNKQTEKDSL